MEGLGKYEYVSGKEGIEDGVDVSIWQLEDDIKKTYYGNLETALTT